MADEEIKGATPTTTMIDTTDTPKKTPMLKLGRKRFGATRAPTDEQPGDQQHEDDNSSRRGDQISCPFNACGRRFVSDDELRSHLQRRHRPPAEVQTEEASTKPSQQTTEPSEKSTPIPTKSKVVQQTSGKTQILKIQASPSAEKKKDFKVSTIQQHQFQGAKPKVMRPSTANPNQGKIGAEQAGILKAMMQAHHMPRDSKNGASGFGQRPKTAATSTAHDEKRIKDKLKYLDSVFDKLDQDIVDTTGKIDMDFFKGMRNPGANDKQQQRQGVRITKKMVIENALMCDELDEITTLMLRDKKISVFDDNLEDEDDEGSRFKLVDLCNIECLLASHNLIKDINGVLQLTTLVELNLSYNMINDINGIEELTQLKTLQLNHNKIFAIDPVSKLLNLKSLGLFYNDIIDGEYTMEILKHCSKLRELSIDGNECAKGPEFSYELLMRLPDLKVLNEEAVKELDRDVAEQYYEMYELPMPKPYKEEMQVVSKLKTLSNGADGADGSGKEKKCVRFQEVNADDLEDCGHEKELKLLHAELAQVELEKYQLQKRLTQSHQDEIFAENERLQLQLRNMFAVMEDNDQMRVELEVLRSSTFDERTAVLAEDNKRLKSRNGELQFELLDVKAELTRIKKSVAHLPNGATAQQQALLMGGSSLPVRPATAAVRSKPLEEQWNEDPNFDIQSAQDDIDKELAEMVKRNQQRLADLNKDLKQVSRVMEEPYVNVRKMKQPARTQQMILKAQDEDIDAV